MSEATSRAEADLSFYDAKIRRRRRHRLVVGITTAITLLIIAAGGMAWAYVSNINERLTAGVDDTLRSVLSEPTKPDDPFYLLLLGVDKYEERYAEYGGDDESNYRSDSIMLVRVDPINVKVTMVSIHRDTLVNLGEHGEDKINAAYSYGGPAYTTKVVSEFAGVPISHYAEVDLDRFIQIVDQVGGVTVNLPVAISDPNYTGISLEAGEQTIDGTTAALLARSRHAYDDYGDGDLYRAANQRMIIAAVVRKVLTLDPASMTTTISSMADCVTTDMDIASILNLASQMKGLNADTDIMTGMEPTSSLYSNNTWYELCDTEAWRAMMRRVDQGLSPRAEGEQDSTAGIAGSVSTTDTNATDTDN